MHDESSRLDPGNTNPHGHACHHTPSLLFSRPSRNADDVMDEGGAPAPSSPPAPAPYTFPCTFAQFAQLVVDGIDAGVVEPHGTDRDGEFDFSTLTVERELRRLAARQYGAEACALRRTQPLGEGFVMPAPGVLLFCCFTGRWGPGVALEMAHATMEAKSAVLKRAIAKKWLPDNSVTAAITVGNLSDGGAVLSRHVLMDTMFCAHDRRPALQTALIRAQARCDMHAFWLLLNSNEAMPSLLAARSYRSTMAHALSGPWTR